MKLRYIDEKANKQKHQADMNHEILIGSWRSFLKKSLSNLVGCQPLYTAKNIQQRIRLLIIAQIGGPEYTWNR